MEKLNNPEYVVRKMSEAKTGKEAALELVQRLQAASRSGSPISIAIGCSEEPRGLVVVGLDEDFLALFSPRAAHTLADLFDRAVGLFPGTPADEVLPGVAVALRDCANEAGGETRH